MVLIFFEAITGLKVNVGKSEIVPVGEVGNLDALAPARGGILTIDNLVKKNLPLVNWRCLCRRDEETVDHILLHCQFASALWCEVLIMFGVQWVMPDTIVSLLFAWRNRLGTNSSKVWNMVPACLMWLVWKERNTRTFEDIERPIDMLKNLLARTLFEWSRI
ncbi:uncharacterized protein LOC142624842 [Castanea sativa]|uniref:uncharacterized protein LOC142624842 n=1 Tax=Castanea sativa TaxID=21020 RepID=UPI003F6516F2